jgi:hypothetical protein
VSVNATDPGHLYRGIMHGLSHLAGRLGEQRLFVGPPRAQATPETSRWPQLVAVTDLKSAHAAIEEIIEQGEGARGDWQSAHYGRFLRIWDEYHRLRDQDPAFDPARPVIPAFTRKPFDISDPQPLLTDPVTRTVAELFNLGYETLLQLLTRFFTHTDETDEQLGALAGGAFMLMGGVLGPLGRTLTRLPAGPEHQGRTAGSTFEMYYQMGNFIPARGAAWAVLSERAAVLASRCADVAVPLFLNPGDVPLARDAVAITSHRSTFQPPADTDAPARRLDAGRGSVPVATADHTAHRQPAERGTGTRARQPGTRAVHAATIWRSGGLRCWSSSEPGQPAPLSDSRHNPRWRLGLPYRSSSNTSVSSIGTPGVALFRSPGRRLGGQSQRMHRAGGCPRARPATAPGGAAAQGQLLPMRV